MRNDLKSWRRKLEGCERLANDPGATEGERASARTKAEQFRAMLGVHENYDAYVERGRMAVKAVHSSQWVIGALAYNVGVEYGKRRLQQYADDIGVAYSTLRNCRTTWEAWPDVRGRPGNFSVAEVLNSHPDRYGIVARFPNITVRQASEVMKTYRESSRPNARSSAAGGQREAEQPTVDVGLDQAASSPSTPPLPLTLDQAREAYLALALKLPKNERIKEAIVVLTRLGVPIKGNV